MKLLRIVWCAVAALSSGCLFVPSPYSDQLKPAVKSYRAVHRGTLRSEIEASFGKPIRKASDGSALWETRFDELNYARLKISFDRHDAAETIEVTNAHGRVAPGFRANAVATSTR